MPQGLEKLCCIWITKKQTTQMLICDVIGKVVSMPIQIIIKKPQQHISTDSPSPLVKQTQKDRREVGASTPLPLMSNGINNKQQKQVNCGQINMDKMRSYRSCPECGTQTGVTQRPQR